MSMAATAEEGSEVIYHLHSKASVFCGGDDEEGLIPVSEDAEDIDAPVLDTVKRKAKPLSLH